jgi:hypothetical protein
MRKKAVVSVRCISAQIFFLLCALLLAIGSPAHGAKTAQRQSIVREPALNVEVHSILPVLEYKIGDRELLAKSKEKIFAMNSRELHLVAALCEKISEEGQTVSSDIAFLLVTALIVLS